MKNWDIPKSTDRAGLPCLFPSQFGRDEDAEEFPAFSLFRVLRLARQKCMPSQHCMHNEFTSA
eukprot:1045490-Amphidinium_carterae.1